MKTIAIVSEYNPFHNGHMHQVNEIRKEFGDNCCIIAVMSGNYTQRGAPAILDKYQRAAIAVECGINLVLELPFPFSMSTAEIFSKSAISILNDVEEIDYISFGSESGDVGTLSEIASIMMRDEYKKEVENIYTDTNRNLCYPEVCELVLKKFYSNSSNKNLLTPNNILAIEYIKALIGTNSKIKPHTIKRMGDEYNASSISDSQYASATAIRESIESGDITALNYVPLIEKNLILEFMRDGTFPCKYSKLSPTIIAHFRLNSPDSPINLFDAAGGLYNRIRDNSFKTDNFDTLVNLTETRKYTKSRIRRVIWHSIFGVTSSDIINSKPLYTQILATDSLGCKWLKKVRKTSKIPILNKPSAVSKLSDEAKRQKYVSDKADSLFQLTKPTFHDGNFSLKSTPYVK